MKEFLVLDREEGRIVGTLQFSGEVPDGDVCSAGGFKPAKPVGLDMSAPFPLLAGKYAGKTYGDVAKDPGYVKWICEMHRQGTLRIKGATRQAVEDIKRLEEHLKETGKLK